MSLSEDDGAAIFDSIDSLSSADYDELRDKFEDQTLEDDLEEKSIRLVEEVLPNKDEEIRRKSEQEKSQDSQPPSDNAISNQSADNDNKNCTLWAWPLNEDGFVRCYALEDKFSVALDFKCLCKEAEIRKFDTYKAGSSSYNFTIGLCSVKKPELCFWRLEVHLFHVNELILVETYREVFDDYSNIESVRISKKLRKLRKTYRLPSQYDINTATVTVSDALRAIVIEALPKTRPLQPYQIV